MPVVFIKSLQITGPLLEIMKITGIRTQEYGLRKGKTEVSEICMWDLIISIHKAV